MPWHIESKKGSFCVVKDSDGSVEKCHPTQDEAQAHMAALYANEPKAWQAQMDWLTAAYDETFPFGRGEILVEAVDGTKRPFKVAIAETQEQKTRGMVGRTFDGFDAMLFCYEEPVVHAFHMRGVPVQLYLAFFDAKGNCFDHVGLFTSDPWEYHPSQPYQWALELPVDDGSREWLSDAVLTRIAIDRP